jgi:hypothetical protein
MLLIYQPPLLGISQGDGMSAAVKRGEPISPGRVPGQPLPKAGPEVRAARHPRYTEPQP